MTGLFILVAMPVLAGFGRSSRGTTAGNFLKLGVNARAVSLGEAYTAVADEASAVTWNPAALTRLEKRSATIMHAAYLESSYFDYAAYGQKLGAKGAIGGAVQYFSYGSIDQLDTTGAKTGSFTPNDMAFSVAYGHEMEGVKYLGFLDGYSLGIGLKFIRSKIVDSASTLAADIGALSPTYLNDKLTLAMTITNVGGKLEYEKDGDPLPTAVRIGSAYTIKDNWRASADLGLPTDNRPYVGVGTEYDYSLGEGMVLTGRGGYNTRTLGDVDGLNGVSLGLGFNYQEIVLDYGLVPFGDLGMAHRVSLSYKF